METTQSNATVKRGVISWYVWTRRFRRGRGGKLELRVERSNQSFDRIYTKKEKKMRRELIAVSTTRNLSKGNLNCFGFFFFLGREIVFTGLKVGLRAGNSRGFYFARVFVGTCWQLDWQPVGFTGHWSVLLLTSFQITGIVLKKVLCPAFEITIVFLFQITAQLYIFAFIFLCENSKQKAQRQSKKKKIWNLIKFFHINIYYNYCGASFHELNMSCVLRMRCYGGKWQEAACNWGGGNTGLLD